MFRLHTLPAAGFAPLFDLDEAALHARHARHVRRVVADKAPGYPCRASLRDADPAIAYAHLHDATPGCYAAAVTRV